MRCNIFQLGREGVKEIAGKTYVFSRLERRIVEQFRDWIKEQEGDPFATVKELLPVLDSAAAKEMIEEAKAVKKQLAAFSLGCPLAQKYMQTELGQGELFYLMLRDKQPQITREEAFLVWTHVAGEKAQEIITQAQGQPPTEKNDLPPAA